MNKTHIAVKPMILRNRIITGFSLIEMMVAITIIAVLVTVTLPAFSGARRLAMQARCASNMRQIGIGNASYMTDYRNWMLVFRSPIEAVYPQATLDHTPDRPDYRNWQSRPDWFTYWPNDIRWCPELLTDFDVKNPSPPSAMSWHPLRRGHQDHSQSQRELLFGYAPVIFTDDMVRRYGTRAAVKPYGGKYQYIRLERSGLMQDNAGTTLVRSNKTASYDGTLPHAFDLIMRNSTNNRYVNPHGDTRDPKNTRTFGLPYGGNALWSDGSAKWYNWTKRLNNFPPEYRVIAFGEGTPPAAPEDWAYDYPGGTDFYFIARRAR